MVRGCFVGGCLALLFGSSIQAQTANDCIAEYEDLKAQFEAVAPDAQLNCVQKGNVISLDTEGPLPAGCTGSWDHWHLEARASGSQEGTCRMMLRGLENKEGCGAEEIAMELPANEAAAWRNYLRKECK